MADDNRPLKYARYAIGEIVLVVIGILIAVQINAWNQDRKRKTLEKVLLAQVKKELLGTYRDIYSDLNWLITAHESSNRIKYYISQNAKYADSMCFDFYHINSDEYIYPKYAAYSKIKEEGLDIIRNDSTRLLIQGIYESTFPRLSRENSFKPDISEYFDSYYLRNFRPNADFSLKYTEPERDSDTLSGEVFKQIPGHYPFEFPDDALQPIRTIGYVPLDFDALKNDAEFNMLLDKTESFRRYKISRYLQAKSLIQKLIRSIDEELTKGK